MVKGDDQAAPQARGQGLREASSGGSPARPREASTSSTSCCRTSPWLYLPSGQQYAENGPIPGLDEDDDRWRPGTETIPRQSFQRYLLQATYVDSLIGELIADLKRRNLFDRALIVVMADHGVSFRAGDRRRRVSQTNFADLASIPLFIKRPGQTTGRVDDSPATSVDVVPTIADFLGAKLSWKPDGVSLMRGPAPDRATVRVATSDRPDMTRAFDSFVRQRDLFSAEAIRLFGTDDRDLYAPPGVANLIGTLTASLPVRARPGARVRLDSAREFQSVDPAAPLVPALVTGQLSGVPVGERVAVSVNGRIEGTGYAYEQQGQTSFDAVVRPEAFRKGANSVRVFALTGSGSEVALQSLGQTGSLGYDLVHQDGQEVLKGRSGKATPVIPDAIGGYLDYVRKAPGGLVIQGWSAIRDRGVADRVAVYLSGRLVAEARPLKERDDVAADLGGPARNSGFLLSARLRAGTTYSPENLRVFGVFGDVAAELVKPPELR